MSDDSGQYDARKLRGMKVSGTWVTLIGMGVAVVAAWATNANRLTNAEQQIVDNRSENQRMETHLSANDQQIAVLKERLQYIIEQLQAVNAKLDRAEEERRK